MQHELQYHLKHQYGISEEFNTHQEAQPWYGMGQGAGNTCNCWVIGSDSMADAYSAVANGWTIHSPNNAPIKQDMKAFIDDMNLFIGKPENTTEEEFMEMVQTDII